MRFMIIVTTGIPMTQQYVLMSACWLELDSEEDGTIRIPPSAELIRQRHF